MRTLNGSARAVGDRAGRPARCRTDVRVLEQVERLERAAGAEVDREHELGADLLDSSARTRAARPGSVSSRVPGEVEPRRAARSRGPTPSSQR